MPVPAMTQAIHAPATPVSAAKRRRQGEDTGTDHAPDDHHRQGDHADLGRRCFLGGRLRVGLAGHVRSARSARSA